MNENRSDSDPERSPPSVHYFSPDWRWEDGIVVRLSCALADVEEEPPEAYAPELWEHVDLDALERLFDGGDERGKKCLILWFRGYEVHVLTDGTLIVRE